MNCVKVSVVRKLLSASEFLEAFKILKSKYVEICTDELDRQVLQIDFTTNCDYSLNSVELSNLGIGITNYLTDKGQTAIFASCSSNGINRMYLRAYVRAARITSDSEVAVVRKFEKRESVEDPVVVSSNEPAGNDVDEKSSGTVAADDEPVFVKILAQAKPPGDRSGLGSPKIEFKPATEAIGKPVEHPRPTGGVSDPTMNSKLDNLRLQTFALEQNVVNLKAKLIEKEEEISKLIKLQGEVVHFIKLSEIPRDVVEQVRRNISRTNIPVKSEKLFVQHHIDRTPTEIVLDTYYLCEYLGLRQDALDAMMHIVDNIHFSEEAEPTARLMYSLMMPHIKFLIKRTEELDAPPRRRR